MYKSNAHIILADRGAYSFGAEVYNRRLVYVWITDLKAHFCKVASVLSKNTSYSIKKNKEHSRSSVNNSFLYLTILHK